MHLAAEKDKFRVNRTFLGIQRFYLWCITRCIGPFLVKSFLAGFITWLTLILPIHAIAQKTDTVKNNVHVVHAEFMRFERQGGKEIQYLSQDIAVFHKKTWLFCDSAVIDGQTVVAMGHVRIVEGDSLQIFGDTLFYDGRLLKSSFKNNVVLIHRDRHLFTNELDYDLKKRIASYLTGGLLSSNTTQLTSIKGYYHAKEERAYFKDSVNVLLEDQMNLQSDSLIFDAKENKVLFTGPTFILQADMKLYTDDGFHDITGKKSVFTGHPRYAKKDQKADAGRIVSLHNEDIVMLMDNAWIRDSLQEASGDSIVIDNKKDLVKIYGNGRYKDKDRILKGDVLHYNRRTQSLEVEGRTTVNEGSQIIEADRILYSGDEDFGRAYGNVHLKDTVSGMTIQSDTFYYNKKEKTLIPVGTRKYISTPIDQDTMYLTADSLISVRKIDGADTFTVMRAYYKVRIWSQKFQALCDSLYFDGRDSTFRLHTLPVMWSDSTQFVGDTILVLIKNKTMDQIHLQNKAFVLTESVSGLNNQMKGRYILSQFNHSKIDFLDVKGNAESHYFIQDESKSYIGANYIKCSKMRIYFAGEQKIDKIHFYTTPEGNMLPVEEGKTKRLEGYESRFGERPVDLESILSPNQLLIEQNGNIEEK
ncbi:MAG: hypothetical protein IPM48_00955 [Saprospiraceae bacterium]|nr:hypothetical protein [Saprospiraceae bacterium]